MDLGTELRRHNLTGLYPGRCAAFTPGACGPVILSPDAASAFPVRPNIALRLVALYPEHQIERQPAERGAIPEAQGRPVGAILVGSRLWVISRVRADVFFCRGTRLLLR